MNKSVRLVMCSFLACFKYCLVCTAVYKIIIIIFFSDELLLQEDNYEVSSLAFGIANNVSLGNATDDLVPSEAGKSSQGHNQARTSSNFGFLNQRYESSLH